MYNQLFKNNQDEVRAEILKEQKENLKFKTNHKFVIKKAVDALAEYH
jgi:hypothetical protein